MLRRAFEQPPAAHRKQRIPDKRHAVVVEDECDMAERVAGDFDHAAAMISDADLVAFGQRNIAPANWSRPPGPEMRAPVDVFRRRFPPV